MSSAADLSLLGSSHVLVNEILACSVLISLEFLNSFNTFVKASESCLSHGDSSSKESFLVGLLVINLHFDSDDLAEAVSLRSEES